MRDPRGKELRNHGSKRLSKPENKYFGIWEVMLNPSSGGLGVIRTDYNDDGDGDLYDAFGASDEIGDAAGVLEHLVASMEYGNLTSEELGDLVRALNAAHSFNALVALEDTLAKSLG